MFGCSCCSSAEIVPKDVALQQQTLDAGLLGKPETVQDEFTEVQLEEEAPKLKKIKTDKSKSGTGKKKKKAKAKKHEQEVQKAVEPEKPISSFTQSIYHATEAPAPFLDPKPETTAAAESIPESKEAQEYDDKVAQVKIPEDAPAEEGPRSVKFSEEIVTVDPPKFEADEAEKAEEATRKRVMSIEGELEPLRKGFTVKKVNPMNTRVVILWLNPDGDKLNWGSKRNAVEKTLSIEEITEIDGSVEEDLTAGSAAPAGDAGFSDDDGPKSSEGGLSPRAGDDVDAEEEGKDALSPPKSDKERERSRSKSGKAPRNLREFKIVAKAKTHIFRTKNAADRARMVRSLKAALERYQTTAMKQVLQDIGSA